jgi:hypothetical protein
VDADVARLSAVLELLEKRGLAASKVRVGSIEVAITAAGDTSPTKEPTHAELVEAARAEFEATMYGASEGADYPIGAG